MMGRTGWAPWAGAGLATALLLAAVALTPRHDASEEALQRTTALWGGFLANLDDTVPRGEVDVAGSLVRARAHTLRGEVGRGQFLSDSREKGSKFASGMYWGQASPLGKRHAHFKHERPGRLARFPGAVMPHRVDRGILGRLEHQRKASPPTWWLKKREAYLAHKQMMRAQNEAMVAHAAKHAAPAQAHHPAARKPAAAPTVAKAAKPADDFPGQATVAAAYRRASQLAAFQKKQEEKQADTAVAEKKAAAATAEAALRARATPAKASALQHTADSLDALAAGMSAASFKATPGKLAAIAKDLAEVSSSLSGTAERAAEAKLAAESK